MQIDIIPVLHDNYSYLLTAGGKALCVDPGEAAPLIEALSRQALTLEMIVITHTHHDHIGGIHELRAHTPCPVLAPQDLPGEPPTTTLTDEMAIPFGDLTLRALSTPGHCPQHFALYMEGHLFCGDLIFSGGCGRILGGTPTDFWASLQRLAALPNDTLIYCGHEYTVDNLRFGLSILPGDPAITEALARAQARLAQGLPSLPVTLGDEKRSNVFLRSGDDDVAAAIQFSGRPPVEVFAELRRRKDRW